MMRLSIAEHGRPDDQIQCQTKCAIVPSQERAKNDGRSPTGDDGVEWGQRSTISHGKDNCRHSPFQSLHSSRSPNIKTSEMHVVACMHSQCIRSPLTHSLTLIIRGPHACESSPLIRSAAICIRSVGHKESLSACRGRPEGRACCLHSTSPAPLCGMPGAAGSLRDCVFSFGKLGTRKSTLSIYQCRTTSILLYLE